MAFDNERWSAAQGEGTVDLPTFYIARTEVSVAEFTKFAQAGKWSVDPRALQAPPNHPVTHVSWTDALAYCRWLDASMKGSLPAGYRVTLPSEAQWEKAARGADGRRYPWGNDVQNEFAIFASTAPGPVGARACPACAYGLADMAGNVWEWTRSPLQPYPYDESNDRANLDADALWVMRGGGFADNAQLIRTTTRGAAEPGARRAFIGFRIALSR